jgi:hypothetical protein
MRSLVLVVTSLLLVGCYDTSKSNRQDAGPDGGDTDSEFEIDEADYWWQMDSCGIYHTLYQDDGTFYYKSTTTPFGNWSAPISLGNAYSCSFVLDRPPGCGVHFRLQWAMPGLATYQQLDGDQLTDPETVSDLAFCPAMFLDSDNQPHFFWSVTDPMHRSRNPDGTWNDEVIISDWVPSGWCPVGYQEETGIWRAVFYRAIEPPNADAQTFESSSSDNGATWDDAYILFPEFEQDGFYAWSPSVLATHGTSNRAIFVRSNKSGEDDRWFADTQGAGNWSTPELLGPLGPDIPTDWAGGIIEPSGEFLFMMFTEREEPHTRYFTYHCFGGGMSPLVAWPSVTGSLPVSIHLAWEGTDSLRAFWKEDEDAASWYTTIFDTSAVTCQ